MAKLRRPLNSERARGSLGDVIFSESNNVNYARRKTIPKYEQTTRRKEVATDLTAASRLWSALTDQGKAQWEEFADSVTKSDVWGTPIKLPAFSWFVGCYMNLRSIKELRPPDIREARKPTPPIAVTARWAGTISRKFLYIEAHVSEEIDDVKARFYWNPKPSAGTFKNKSELELLIPSTFGVDENIYNVRIQMTNEEAAAYVGNHTIIAQLIDTRSGLASAEYKTLLTIEEP